ncbi:MAG: hypothetical protein IKD80_04125 [Selenomonadaceae bacterium]|nr:hypothetical protein [Selenomonadaceae bacterium]
MRNWNAIISNQEDVTEAINVTLAEFEDRYYLHDSSIDKIDFDADKKILTLTIDFCFWMQNWYDATIPKNGLITVTFENVSRYSYEDYDPTKFFCDRTPEILHTEISDDGTLILCTFEFVRYEPGEDLYPVMKINADNVIVDWEVSSCEH